MFLSGRILHKRLQIRNNILDDGSGVVFNVDYRNCFPYQPVDTVNQGVFTYYQVGATTSLAQVSDGRALIESTTANSPATLQVDNATNMNYVDLKDIVFNGADTYIGATSVIRSNVKGVRRGPKTGLGV